MCCNCLCKWLGYRPVHDYTPINAPETEAPDYGTTGRSTSTDFRKKTLDRRISVLAESKIPDSEHFPKTQSTPSSLTSRSPLAIPTTSASISPTRLRTERNLELSNSHSPDPSSLNTPPKVDCHKAWGSPDSTKTTPVKTPKSTSSSNHSSPEKSFKW